MTSGQDSGSQQEPEDRPGSPPPASGWAPAPPPPPSSPGYPQGSGYPPAPPGYPSYPGQGYGPAPSAPQGYGAPTPVPERPGTVRFGLGAVIAGLILSAIGLIYETVNFSSILDAETASFTEQQRQQVGQLGPSFVHSLVVATLVIGALFILLEAMFVWFAWNGRNWARIVLWVVLGLGVAFGIFGVAGNSASPGFLRGLGIFQWLLDIAAVVLLARPQSNEWYRYRKWLRATGRPK